jgi:hypothetical protein
VLHRLRDVADFRGVFVTTFTTLDFEGGVVEQALRIIATTSAINMDFRIPPETFAKSERRT